MLARYLVRSSRSLVLFAALFSATLALAAASAGAAEPAGTFMLRSPGLTPGAAVPRIHVYDRDGCRGRNVSPALKWRHPPIGTRSFALLMFDPDAPGGGWWHWLVFDLPAQTRSLPAGAGDPGGALPKGAIQARNDYGFPGYGGPCPPPGPAHHYRITLYALNVESLQLDAHASAAAVAAAVRAAQIARAEITLVYAR